MSTQEIEDIFNECREMSSDEVFNLIDGHHKQIDYKRYSELLEEMLRMTLDKSLSK